MLELESNVSKLYLNKINIQKVEPPILAIDYGTKNFGLAISDQKGIVAQPLKTLKANKNIFSEIQNILNEYKIKTIVLGIPQVFEESHLQNIRPILKFRNLVSEFTKKEVFLYDESYSTSTSYSILRDQGENQKKARKKIDTIAATCFLQELIDFKKSQNE